MSNWEKMKDSFATVEDYINFIGTLPLPALDNYDKNYLNMTHRRIASLNDVFENDKGELECVQCNFPPNDCRCHYTKCTSDVKGNNCTCDEIEKMQDDMK